LAELRWFAQSPKVSEPTWLPKVVKVESLWDSVFVVCNLEFGGGLSRFGVTLLLALSPFLGLFRLLLLTGALFLAFIERRTRVSSHEAPLEIS
jgi:hypothetical protein